MTQTPDVPVGGAQSGRRLVGGLTPGAPPVAITPTGDTELANPHSGMMPAAQLVFAGDVVSASTTLAIDLDTGGVSFFRYEHRTLVQPGEEHEDVYARVAQVTNDGVINLIDDVEDRLQQHELEQKAREAALQQQQQQ